MLVVKLYYYYIPHPWRDFIWSWQPQRNACTQNTHKWEQTALSETKSLTHCITYIQTHCLYFLLFNVTNFNFMMDWYILCSFVKCAFIITRQLFIKCGSEIEKFPEKCIRVQSCLFALPSCHACKTGHNLSLLFTHSALFYWNFRCSNRGISHNLSRFHAGGKSSI